MVHSLVYLPDNILLDILSKLHAPDLYNLSSIHPRFAKLIEDKYIWKHVHFGYLPLSLQHIRRFVKYLGVHTYSLHITGHIKSTTQNNPKRSQCLSEAFFLSLKRRCPNLKELSLNKCYIDSSSIKFSCFPSSLERLCLSGSALINLPQIRTRLNSPFFRIEKHLPHLKHIQLDGCKSWLSYTDITLLKEKCNNLNIIDLGNGHHFLGNGKNR